MTVGVTRNPYEVNVPNALLSAADRLGIATRVIDLATVRAAISASGETSTLDRNGPISVESLTPFLLFGFPAAVHAYRMLARGVRSQNPVEGVLAADDKAATAELLAAAGVPQVATEIVGPDVADVSAAAERFGYPIVVKRTHGAQGRWVRRAVDAGQLATAVAELTVEGPAALVVQPEIVECAGRSIRAVLTGGQLLASTQRVASAGGWRSNVAAGARQHRVDLTDEERRLVNQSLEALGLKHAGIDILRTNRGPRILEVNACPAFTSMQAHYDGDLAEAVLLASIR
jgi:ribosomal protein S6--L-glutamate ligase